MDINERFFAQSRNTTDAIRNNQEGTIIILYSGITLGKDQRDHNWTYRAAITKTFGSFDKFKEAFSTAAKTRFGSGWAWLYITPDKKLAIASTPNQDNPLWISHQLRGHRS